MAEHPNATLSRRGFEAFIKGDFVTQSKIFADDMVWHVAGKSLISGDYEGRQTVFKYFEKLMELTDGTLRPQEHDIIGSDEHAVMLLRTTGTRKDKMIDLFETLVFHLRGSQAIEVWQFSFKQYVWDEFWS